MGRGRWERGNATRECVFEVEGQVLPGFSRLEHLSRGFWSPWLTGPLVGWGGDQLPVFAG